MTATTATSSSSPSVLAFLDTDDNKVQNNRDDNASTVAGKTVTKSIAVGGTRRRQTREGSLYVVSDPNTFSALAYSPPPPSQEQQSSTPGNDTPLPPPPLILVLHGAGRNGDTDLFRELADLRGEHAGSTIPALIASSTSTTAGDGSGNHNNEAVVTAPSNLLSSFAVLAPYSGKGTTSFYELPRRSVLDFVDWARRSDECPEFDPSRVVVWGFSDGATVAVELLTSGKFAAGVVCGYGYTGSKLPQRALERLAGVPVWVFHSQDDTVFDIRNSDRLVEQLLVLPQQSSDLISFTGSKQASSKQIVRYTRLKAGTSGGHVGAGVAAARSPQVYDWLLEQLPAPVAPQANIYNDKDDHYDGLVP